MFEFARNGKNDENYKITTEFYDYYLKVLVVTMVPSILFPSANIEFIILEMKVYENFPFTL